MGFTGGLFPLWCIIVGRTKARRYLVHQAPLKSEGKERYDDDDDDDDWSGVL